jgi:alkylation response protein AidB-like acyl-CoA dehydrogenase
MTDTATPPESVDELRRRARTWLADNLPRLADDDHGPGDRNIDSYARDRELQRQIWEGRLAGIAWPVEYGGLGLSAEHQRAFTEESLDYVMPRSLNVPTFGILAATLIDFGTHEQKTRHLPAILQGEEMWVQFLSEPTGGSDLAGCITRATRDGDVFVLNGSKIWSSAAYAGDYAMCLARTNWDVPKHRGLTMFLMKIHQPGVQVDQIRQVNGSMEFCQEFFDDVVIPVSDVVGEIDEGWTVASRLLLHERTAVGGASPYTSGRTIGSETASRDRSLVDLAAQTGRSSDARVRQLVAAAHVEHLVSGHLAARVSEGMTRGLMPPASGSMLKLFHAVLGVKKAEAGLEIAGSDAVAWPVGSDDIARRLGEASLSRQAMCLGGGSNEIQKNIISERVLGMPREWAADRDVAYRDVKHATMPTGPR